jgi:hypothetical protein
MKNKREILQKIVTRNSRLNDFLIFRIPSKDKSLSHLLYFLLLPVRFSLVTNSQVVRDNIPNILLHFCLYRLDNSYKSLLNLKSPSTSLGTCPNRKNVEGFLRSNLIKNDIYIKRILNLNDYLMRLI